jgi:hypothetical protein
LIRRQAAGRLGLSYSTVKHHLANARSKVGAETMAQLVPSASPMGADDSGVIEVTQRELLMEMRDDIRALRSVVDSVARDQALSVERRSAMQRVADTITARLDSHEKAILELQRWRDEAAGAIRLARWALGASLLASVLIVLQIAALSSHAVNPAVPVRS